MLKIVPLLSVMVIAHRGAHQEFPENTMPAYRAAIELGCDMVEVDIRETADGQYVSFHDSELDRKTDGCGPVASYTLEELKQLEAGAWFNSSFSGERIPTFAEVLSEISGNIGAYVDVKNAPPDSVVAFLQRHNMVETSVVYASPEELSAMQKLDGRITPLPELPRSLADLPALAERLDLTTIAISNTERVTSENVAACHAVGLKVFADLMGRDGPEGWRHAIDCGVDGIQTDRPAELMAWLRGEQGGAGEQ